MRKNRLEIKAIYSIENITAPELNLIIKALLKMKDKDAWAGPFADELIRMRDERRQWLAGEFTRAKPIEIKAPDDDTKGNENAD